MSSLREAVNGRGSRSGVYFGATSGVITTVGLMVGLNAGTESPAAVIGGVLVIAVADGMSDALGMHLAQESDPAVQTRHVWGATVSTFLAKFLVTSTFLVPLLVFPLTRGVTVGVGWGLVLLTAVSVSLARTRGVRALPVVAEHLTIGGLVVALSHVLGRWVHGSVGSLG